MQALDAVDGAGVPLARSHAPEEPGHTPVDGFLGGAERRGHLLVAHALGHHVEDLAIALVGLTATGEPLGDGRVHRAAAGCHLADRPSQLVALGDPVLEQIGQTAVPPAQQRDRVGLVIVGGEHHNAGLRMGITDRVRAVDPFQLERGRHLDVGHHDVGCVLGRGR